MATEATTKKKHAESRLQRVLRAFALTVSLLFLVALGVLYWASKTGYAGEWAKAEVVRGLHQACAVDASFGTFTFDPFPPSISMSGLELTHTDGRRLLSVDQAIVSLQILPLFARRLQLDRVALLAPKAAIALEQGEVKDLPVCLKPKPDAKETEPITLGIRELTIERGEVELKVDERFRAELHGIDIGLNPRRQSSGSDVKLALDPSLLVLDGRELPLSRLRFLGQIEGLLTSPRAVVIGNPEASDPELRRGIDVEVAGVSVAGSASIDLLGPVYEAKLEANLPLPLIDTLVPTAPKLDGKASLEVSVSGTAASPRGTGHVVLDHAKVDAFSLGDTATIDFSADLGRKSVEVRALDVRLGDGGVKAKARLELDEHLSIAIETEAEDLSLARVLESVGVPGAWVDFRARGKSTLGGTLIEPTKLEGRFDYDLYGFYVFDRGFDRPEVRDHASASPKHVLLHPPGHIQAAGKWAFSPNGLAFSDAKIASGQTSGRADAAIPFGAGARMHVDATLAPVDFADIGPIAGIRFGGRGSVAARLEGPLSAIAGLGTLELEDINVSGIPFGHARGSLVWHDDVRLDFHDIQGKLGETAYSGELGVVIDKEVPFVIKGALGEGRVPDLLIPFGQRAEDWGSPAGRVTGGSFSLTGPITKLSGPIDLSFSDLSVVGERFERGRMAGRMEDGAVVCEDLELEKHGAFVMGKGRLDPNTRLVRGSAKARGMTLQKIDLLHESQPSLDGKLGLEVAVIGDLDSVTGTVAARLTDLVAGPVPLGTGAFKGRIQGAKLTLAGRVLERASEARSEAKPSGDRRPDSLRPVPGEYALDVRGEVALRPKLAYAAELDLGEYDLPKLMSGLQGHTRWTGKVAAKAKLSGSLVDWHLSSGDILVDHASVDTGSFAIETTGPAAFVMRQGVLDTRHLGLSGPRTKLDVEGLLGAHVLDLEVKGKIDLAIAELVSPSVERAGGALTLDAAIQGSPEDMSMVGTGRVDSGILQWRGFDGRLTGFSSNLTFSQSTVLIERGEGRFADGRVLLSGTVELDNYRVKTIGITVGLDEVRPKMTYPMVDLSGNLKGSITADGPLDHLVVRGGLDVRTGRARPKVEITNLGDKSRMAVNVYDPSQETVDMDLSFHLIDPLHIKNDQVDLELKGDLRLTGTNQRFGMLGTTNMLRGGRVAVFRKEYEMIAGVIEFEDRYRFAPRYDLTVTTDACSAKIQVNLTGNAQSSPHFAYSSSPSMDEQDISSCLVRGVRVQDRYDDLAKMASGTFFHQTGLDREVKKVLPVDDIEVTSEYSSQTKTYEPRVLLAKELTVLGGPARLEYTSALGKREDQELRVRYRITPTLTLQGGWSSAKIVQPVVGDLHLDLKYRWEW